MSNGEVPSGEVKVADQIDIRRATGDNATLSTPKLSRAVFISGPMTPAPGILDRILFQLFVKNPFSSSSNNHR